MSNVEMRLELISVPVSDVDRAKARGEIQDYPWGRFVYFSDPDGNGWAVQQLQPAAAA